MMMQFSTIILLVFLLTVSATDNNIASTVFGHQSNTNTNIKSGLHVNGFHDPYHITQKQPICPNPNDPSAVFGLGTDSALEAAYPGTEIAAELTSRPNLAAVLVQEIPSQSGLDLTVPADLPFDGAEIKCTTQSSIVWTFTSAQNRGICWVLQGFQSPVVAVNCVNPECKGCDRHNTYDSSFNAFNDAFWSSFNFPNFPSTSFNYPLLPTYKNICTPRFEVKTIWAYCPQIPDALKVVREQIIVPVACGCKKVQCPLV